MFDRCFVCVFEENDRLKSEVERLTGLLKDDSYLNGLLADRDYMLTFMEQGVLVEMDELKSRLSAMKDVVDAAVEAMGVIADEGYTIDSYTFQPLRNALAKLEGGE